MPERPYASGLVYANFPLKLAIVLAGTRCTRSLGMTHTGTNSRCTRRAACNSSSEHTGAFSYLHTPSHINTTVLLLMLYTTDVLLMLYCSPPQLDAGIWSEQIVIGCDCRPTMHQIHQFGAVPEPGGNGQGGQPGPPPPMMMQQQMGGEQFPPPGAGSAPPQSGGPGGPGGGPGGGGPDGARGAWGGMPPPQIGQGGAQSGGGGDAAQKAEGKKGEAAAKGGDGDR